MPTQQSETSGVCCIQESLLFLSVHLKFSEWEQVLSAADAQKHTGAVDAVRYRITARYIL